MSLPEATINALVPWYGAKRTLAPEIIREIGPHGVYWEPFCGSGGPETRWAGVVRSIPAWRRRMDRVQILSGDGVEMCEKIEDREGTAIYADPPYLAKGAKYLHDFADADHLRLAEALRRFRKTRVVVSYYDDPRLADLYPGWNARPLVVAKSMVNSGMRDRKGATRAPEVLLVNGPLRGGSECDLFGGLAS